MLLEFGVYMIKHSFSVLFFTTILGLMIGISFVLIKSALSSQKSTNSEQQSENGSHKILSKGTIILSIILSLIVMFFLNLIVGFITIHTWNSAPIVTEKVIKAKQVGDEEYEISTATLKNKSYIVEDKISKNSTIRYRKINKYIRPITNKEFKEMSYKKNHPKKGALDTIIDSAVDSQKKRFEN